MSESPHLDITSTGQNSRTVLVCLDWLCAAFRLNCPVSLVSDSSVSIAHSKPWPARVRSKLRPYRIRSYVDTKRTRSIVPRHNRLYPFRVDFETDRNTRSTESTLVPKVRIYFAEFPSLLSAVRPEAAHLGDLMRFLVRSRRPRIIRSLEFSRVPRRYRRPQRMRPFSATRTHSADDPTPASDRLNVVREPTPAQRETSSSQKPLPTVCSTVGQLLTADHDPFRSGRRGAGILAGYPFVAHFSAKHFIQTCVFDLGATDPISFADRSETFSTTALRVLPKLKLLPPR